jgi:restriction system protein
MIDYTTLVVTLKPSLKIIFPAIIAFLSISYAFKGGSPKKVSSKKEKINIPTWSLDLLLSLEWKRYERICKELLLIEHKNRFNVELTPMGADGGIDLKVTNAKHKVIAIGQCKAWNNPVGVSLIRELYGVMASERVEIGYFFTTSSFSHDAIQFTKGKKIKLFDGNQQIKMLLTLPLAQQANLIKIATEGDYTTPTCPSCDKKMIKRTGERGEFWGCVNYPRCKTTINVRKHS